MSTNYKYCVVPCCTNSSFRTPGKLFFNVPKDEKKRKIWFKIMKRERAMSSKSTVSCCEDHFSLEDDMENFWQYKLIGDQKRLRLKPYVVPHLFSCQRNKAQPESDRSCILKRKRKALVEDAISAFNNNVSSASIDPCINKVMLMDENPDFVQSNSIKMTNKCTQVNIRASYRSKGVNTNTEAFRLDRSTSPIKTSTREISTSTEPEILLSSDLSENDLSEYESNEHVAIDSDLSIEELKDIDFKVHMQQASELCIERFPKLYLGIPKESFFVLDLIMKSSGLPKKHVCIVLKKLRLNDSFQRLGIEFGMSKSNASRIFSNSLAKIAGVMEKLIIWPEDAKIRQNLPIPFRARYGKVISIVDCLEIQIEKPSNSLHQSLTWSQYKGCNTLKYLISCTPDGLVNFVSCGYGGRASDNYIIENCGYLDRLNPGNLVMADRGFKHVSHLLQAKQCVLVRPRSVFCGAKSSDTEVRQSKRTAALHIHVERVIGRLRDFKMLLPHSCIDNHLVPMTDDIIKIACGVINLQNHLIKF